MERWVSEEPLHGELLDRFLEEAGHPSEDRWFENTRARTLAAAYRFNDILHRTIAFGLGRRFAGVHMTIGAINELTTLTGYQRLWTLAKHPVLERLLRGIAREEAMHYFFYWSVARIKLLRSGFARKLNRAITSRFWVPVGQGVKTAAEANAVMRALFSGDAGLALVDRQVNQRMEQLPGLDGLKVVTRRIAGAVGLTPV